MNNRYLYDQVAKDLQHKMVFIGGARQVGKTTLSKQFLPSHLTEWYMNWDYDRDRERILCSEFPSGPGTLILDEIHKYNRWRQVVKGLFDKRKDEIKIIVTGSAKLDYYRRGGDSLQGRYHFLRLGPLSVRELGITSLSTLQDLLTFSGFPEPYFTRDLTEHKRWQREYRTRLIREDLTSLEKVTSLSQIELLAMRLPELVCSPLSLNSLREDLQVSHESVHTWVEILERLYYLFRIYPFGARSIRAIKKAPKHYHYDWSLVPDPSARLENFVAVHLIKWCHYLQDTEGRDVELRYFRDTDQREVDFVLCEDNAPTLLVECKSSSRPLDRGLGYLRYKFPKVRAVQLTPEDDVSYTDKNNVEFLSITKFLNEFI